MFDIVSIFYCLFIELFIQILFLKKKSMKDIKLEVGVNIDRYQESALK